MTSLERVNRKARSDTNNMVLIDRILQPLRRARAAVHNDGRTWFSSGDSFRVQAKHIRKTFRHRGQFITALDDASVEVLEGEFLAIVGRSGAGKTSLVNILAGWDRATHGTVRVFGRDPFTIPRGEAAHWHTQTIGYVPQKRVWARNLSVLETVEAPLAGAVRSRANRFDQVMDTLEVLRISRLAKLFPGELTVSDQLRVAVARAMVADPRLLLLDQLGSSSDAETTIEILEVLKRLNECQGTTVIVTGNDHRVAKFAVRTQLLAEGRLEPLPSVDLRKYATDSP